MSAGPGPARPGPPRPGPAAGTGPAVRLLHPDVAVVLGHAGLRVEEGQAQAALGAQARVVAAAVLDGLAVEVLAEAAGAGAVSTGWRGRPRTLPVPSHPCGPGGGAGAGRKAATQNGVSG